MDFGLRLKLLREEKGKTQQDVADALGIGRPTIAGYETKGKQPDYEKLQKLADYFNVSTDYLLGRTNIKNYNKMLIKEFTSPEEAMKFILEQNVIMGFGGFNVNKMSDNEIVDFANELLRQLKLLSYKYK
jgi:transcriptional regulator with XRE-family HTH domain